jgi:maltooligosyltrehalose trehalohydrolase
MNWQPTLGAVPEEHGARFQVWAPLAQSIELVLEKPAFAPRVFLRKNSDGTFSGFVPAVRAGDRYRFRVDGRGPFPDPASRYQPQGVHGPSEVIDPNRFPWSDAAWRGVDLDGLVLYELHVGTFTQTGTFSGVTERLGYLAELGVTAVELMPTAQFAGRRNWGYDGVHPFAPANCYGRPDDLRRLVDSAHALGLAVILDVVYNHLGPDGNYLAAFSPYYFSRRHQTLWGPALNFDDLHHEKVREFFIENALHWLCEYHCDGLRLDATHAIVDDSSRHFLGELVERVHESVTDRQVLLIAEDHRNLAVMVKPAAAGGWGLDAVWADDFHHQVRRLLAGDHEGYYRDYSGTVEDLAATIQRGWYYCGQKSVHFGAPRGTDPTGISPPHFVYCIQNHDQIGNRALGERLNHQIDLSAYRAASALLLCSPATPLLFMGQEWAASTPFLYFTDHHSELGERVTQGRREEFRHFAAFSDPQARTKIPDPQAESTFIKCRLDWSECEREPHAGVFRLYRSLLALRQTKPALRFASADNVIVEALDGETILIVRSCAAGSTVLAVCRLKSAGRVALFGRPPLRALGDKRWNVLLTTEDPPFSMDPCPPHVELSGRSLLVHFDRPAAILFQEARDRGNGNN